MAKLDLDDLKKMKTFINSGSTNEEIIKFFNIDLKSFFVYRKLLNNLIEEDEANIVHKSQYTFSKTSSKIAKNKDKEFKKNGYSSATNLILNQLKRLN